MTSTTNKQCQLTLPPPCVRVLQGSCCWGQQGHARVTASTQQLMSTLGVLLLLLLTSQHLAAAAETAPTGGEFWDLLPQLAAALQQLAVAGITPDLLQASDGQDVHQSLRPSSGSAEAQRPWQMAKTGLQDSNSVGVPTADSTAAQLAQEADQTLQGRRLQQQELAASSAASLSDLTEALMSFDTSTSLTGQNAAAAAAVLGSSAPAVGSSSGAATTSGVGGGAAAGNNLAINCFSLPIELCIALRRANLDVARWAYPYVLGYLAVAWAGLLQTLLAATSAVPGQLVLDAQLLLVLCQQATLIVALLGGLMIVATADRLYRMLPM